MRIEKKNTKMIEEVCTACIFGWEHLGTRRFIGHKGNKKNIDVLGNTNGFNGGSVFWNGFNVIRRQDRSKGLDD